MIRTFFANQAVVAIVGIVGVAQPSMGVFELKEFMPMLARMTSARKEKKRNVRAIWLKLVSSRPTSI